MSIQISCEYFILLVKLNNGLFVMLISSGLHQKLMHTNLLSRSLSKVNDLYWGLQKCACDSNTTCGLVIILMNC